MANIFIIHGAEGNPEENWFPWLKKELESLGHQVFVPQFPTPNGQTLGNWLEIFDNYEQDLNEDSIVIGHNLGVPFLLNVIESLQHPISATFLVAGFTGSVDNKFNDSMKTFAQRDFNWDLIKSNCKKFYIYHSDNDPYIPLEKAEELANNLSNNVTLVEDAGHFNTSSGYDKFELLLEEIKTELEQ